MRIAGAILAGGKSRRMGRDKAFVAYDGTSLLRRAIDRLEPQVFRSAVAGGPRHLRLIGFGAPTLADHPGAGGPAAALPTALAWAGAVGADWLAVQPLDMPHLPGDWVSLLAGEDAAGPRLVGPENRPEPAVGLWPVAVRAALVRVLREEAEPSLRFVARRLSGTYYDIGAGSSERANLNTPDQLMP